jgi:hypothetical protein
MILEELFCSNKPDGVECSIENKTVMVMIACWCIWCSRRQIKNKEVVPTIERIVVNIKGIVANCAKLKRARNSRLKPTIGGYKLNVDVDVILFQLKELLGQ